MNLWLYLKQKCGAVLQIKVIWRYVVYFWQVVDSILFCSASDCFLCCKPASLSPPIHTDTVKKHSSVCVVASVSIPSFWKYITSFSWLSSDVTRKLINYARFICSPMRLGPGWLTVRGLPVCGPLFKSKPPTPGTELTFLLGNGSLRCILTTEAEPGERDEARFNGRKWAFD